MLTVERKYYELMIFQDEQLIYYHENSSSQPPSSHNSSAVQSQSPISSPDYPKLQQQHRIQNTLGVSKSIDALIKQLHPDASSEFRNFKTKEYQFNQYDTINGLKVILITALRSDADGVVDNVLKTVYEGYLNYVKKNYLFEVGKPIIGVKMFEEEVSKALKTL